MHQLLLMLYSVALWLVQPVLRAKLKRRALAEPLYGEDMQERFGYYVSAASVANNHTVRSGQASSAFSEAWVWIHAVSLGETRTAAIVLAQLRTQMPGMRLLLTHGTATGRQEGARLLLPGDQQVWQPWDTAGATKRFMQHFKPRIGIIMETEVWPNLCAAAQRAGVPMVLANARLSAESAAKARRMAWLAHPAYASFTQVWAQTPEDAQRLTAAGAGSGVSATGVASVSGPGQVSVQGNVKFDATPPAELIERGAVWRTALHRPVVVLASSRAGEEALLLENIKQEKWQFTDVKYSKYAINKEATHNEISHIPTTHDAVTDSQRIHKILWLIVPRHPQRFDEVAALIQHAGLSCARRSQWLGEPGGQAALADVWLGDSVGEMALYYGLADCALLGGSFEPLGGQNLIESIACGCPIIMGPHTFNFTDAANTAQSQGAGLRVENLQAGVVAAVQLASNTAQRLAMQQAGVQWLSASQGAAQRMAQAVVQLLQ